MSAGAHNAANEARHLVQTVSVHASKNVSIGIDHGKPLQIAQPSEATIVHRPFDGLEPVAERLTS